MAHIDFDLVYYHCLESNMIFRMDESSESQFKKLESILKTGFIYSRANIKLHAKDFDKLGNFNIYNFNGEDCVSICKRKHEIIRMETTSYLMLVKTNLSILLSNTIKKDLPFVYTKERIDGEYHVKDQIPISYICGLSLAISPTNTQLIHDEALYAKALFLNKGMDIPIFNVKDGNKEILLKETEVKEKLKCLEYPKRN